MFVMSFEWTEPLKKIFFLLNGINKWLIFGICKWLNFLRIKSLIWHPAKWIRTFFHADVHREWTHQNMTESVMRSFGRFHDNWRQRCKWSPIRTSIYSCLGEAVFFIPCDCVALSCLSQALIMYCDDWSSSLFSYYKSLLTPASFLGDGNYLWHTNTSINRKGIEVVDDFKYLGTITDARLSCNSKGLQSLYFMLKLRQFTVDRDILVLFYCCFVESILTVCEDAAAYMSSSLEICCTWVCDYVVVCWVEVFCCSLLCVLSFLLVVS